MCKGPPSCPVGASRHVYWTAVIKQCDGGIIDLVTMANTSFHKAQEKAMSVEIRVDTNLNYYIFLQII